MFEFEEFVAEDENSTSTKDRDRIKDGRRKIKIIEKSIIKHHKRIRSAKTQLEAITALSEQNVVIFKMLDLVYRQLIE